MGRPLNSKFFGTLAGAGFQVGCTADQGSGNAACYIVRQRSNRKYIVADVATGLVKTVAKTVNGAPTAPGEMSVEVTPEMAQAPRQATIAITAAGGTGALLTVEIVDPGYGYFSAGTAVAQDGGDGTIDYTVANGQLATVGINSAGTANVDGTYDIGDAPAVSAPTEYAKIIRNNHVVTFQGNRYVWPASGGAGSGSASGMGEATLQGS